MNKILSEIPLSERPYRSCVGLMVFNKDGNVFCGQRLDNKAEAWQLPQGGIDEGELPIEAGFRELKEETSIINVEFLCEFPEWIDYSYDNYDNDLERWFKYTESVKKLFSTKSAKDLFELKIKDKDILTYNRQQFFKRKYLNTPSKAVKKYLELNNYTV